MGKFLVTGGLGVIASKFVRLSLDSGNDVTIIDSAEEPRNLWVADQLSSKYKNRINILKQRVEKTDFISMINDYDLLMHAAAHTGIPHSELDPTDDWVSNVDASRSILEAMRQTNSKVPTVMLSSVKPYKLNNLTCITNGQRTVWPHVKNGVDETFVLEPDEPYAASKMAQTGLVMAYGRSYNLPVTVLRCSNLYGDAPCHGPRHGWLTWFCISAVLDHPINIQGTGFQTRDMLFSDDVASAVLAARDNINELKGNVYNIGGGSENSVSCIEAVDVIEDVLGRSVRMKKSGARKNDDLVFLTNYSKFSNATKWKPSVSVKSGITRIIDWASKNKQDLKNMYSEYLNA